VGGDTGTATQLFTILSNAVAGVVDLETQLSGFSPSSILSQLIALFPGAASGLSGLTGLGGIFSDLVGFVGSPTGLGSGSPASAVSATSVPALRGLFSGGTFLTTLIPNLNADIITAGTLSSSLIEGIEGTGSTLLGDVSSIVEGAGAETASAAGTLISDASGAISDATNVISGAVSTAATDFGGAVGSILGSFLGLTGSSAESASAAQAASAAAAVASAQAAQAQQTAAINAQLPKFYGGAGTSGLNAQVSLSGATPPTLPSGFTNKGPLSATLSGTSTPGAQFAALFNQVADTDQETTSRIDSTPITVNGGARYLFLRVNSGFTSYLFVKYGATTGFTSPATNGGNPTSVFTVELGCVVAGVETIFDTLTFGATQEQINADTEAQKVVADQGAATAIQLIAASANNNISLEATADAITFTYPSITGSGNVASLAFSDTSGISQIGASFRQAGFGTDESPVVFPLSFAFFDSGPTSGPQAAFVATAATTTSSTFGELSDNSVADQVTINVGLSGIVDVAISANMSSNGDQPVMSYSLSGANTRAASASPSVQFQNGGSEALLTTYSGTFMETGLKPGPTTFQLKYEIVSLGSNGTATFSNRRIRAIPY